MSFHDDSVKKIVHDLLETDPPSAECISTYTKLLNEGHFEQKYVELFVQQWSGRSKYSIYEGYAFMMLHHHLWQGRIALVYLDCDEPHDNAMVAENQRILNKLPKSVKARFNPQKGGGADGDGSLQWLKPLIGTLGIHVDTDETAVAQTRILPGQIPLEVGTTMASRTLAHILSDGGVARWPYGHDRITLLISRQIHAAVQDTQRKQ